MRSLWMLVGSLLLFTPLQAHAQLVGVLRPTEIQAGTSAIIKPCPGPPWPCTPTLAPYASTNIVSAAATSAWLAKDTAAGEPADSTTCAIWADPGTNGERCGGVFSRMTPVVGNVTKAVTLLACDAKGTDRLMLRVLSANVVTNALTWTTLQSKYMPLGSTGKIVVYAGSDPAADCSCRADHACHCYCQQVKVCLKTETLANGNTRFTGTAHALGTGTPGNGHHYDPLDLTLTLLETVTYEGPRSGVLAGIPASGSVGIAAANVQGLMESAFTGFTVTP